MSEPPHDLFGLVGGSLDGKYDVFAPVAEGGYGIVYQAIHVGLQKQVALKVLKVPDDLPAAARNAFLAKFTQEARLIAALDHPAIVRVLDFGVSPMLDGVPSPWMALEWLDGVTLETWLAARHGQPMSPEETYAILAPVLSALAAAHDEGISHRDLKPGNLMLCTSRRGDTQVKVLDFGIAKHDFDGPALPSGHTKTASMLVAFSPQYAAPEQVTGLRTGAWTDVHALALIAVEMLTGREPYESEDTGDLYSAVLSPTRPTPATKGVDVGAWEPVLATALAFKSADRFAHAAAFDRALRDSLGEAQLRPIGDLPRVPSAVVKREVETLRGAEIVSPPRARPPAWLVPATIAAIAIAAAVWLRYRPFQPNTITPTTSTALPSSELRPSPTSIRHRLPMQVDASSQGSRSTPDFGEISLITDGAISPTTPNNTRIRSTTAPTPQRRHPIARQREDGTIPIE